MQLDLSNLPSDTTTLHHLIRDIVTAIEHKDGEIERLQTIIKQLQRAQYGRRSERLSPDQLALGLEDVDSDIGRAEESQPPTVREPRNAPARRKPLPDHLPRDDVRLDVESDVCSCCGGTLHVIGESVSEMLDWIPAQLRVVRTTRPKYACRGCGTVAQAAAPERPIAGGLATPALLAQVLVSKYCDHTPLYRQSQIFARHGIDLCRSTLAGWVGGACWWLEALHERLCRNVFASDHLFADDTPVPVLDPGRGRTKTGRLWVYAREQRGWGGPEPPAAVYLFAPDRKAERPVSHLADFKGSLHVDGYAGFERVASTGDVVLAACWSHTRRKFYEVAETTGSPIATEALRRIADLYAIEERARGQSPAHRLAERRSFSKPIIDAFQTWLEAQLEGDADRKRGDFRYPKRDQLAFSPRLAEQLAITAARQGEPRLNQADRAVAQIMSFPGAFGNAFGAEQNLRDHAICAAVQPRVQRSERERQALSALRRELVEGWARRDVH